MTNPKIFLKAPWAQIYTNFEGGARAKNCVFLVKIFQKYLKTLFLPVFQHFAGGVEILTKIGFFSALGELEKSIWSI